jgi:hypothetical protein
MYEWSSGQKNLFLITGHTHQPVFESLTHLERLQRREALGRDEKHDTSTTRQNYNAETRPLTSEFFSKIKPSYFNTGCCCYDDGDITGIEIINGNICLIKWEEKDGSPFRTELERKSLQELAKQLN